MNDMHTFVAYVIAILVVVAIGIIWSYPINRLLNIPVQQVTSPCKSKVIMASVIVTVVAAVSSMVCVFWWAETISISIN
jgi:hypothetical protein